MSSYPTGEPDPDSTAIRMLAEATQTPRVAPTSIGLIWAQARGGVIGAQGTMPWHLPEDLAHFRSLTADCPVIMGRATWQSLPESYRPLPGRQNIVLTSDDQADFDGAERASSLQHALDLADGECAWIIGGGQVYAQAMELATRLEVTEIDLEVAGDTHAPRIDERWEVESVEPFSGWSESRTGLRYRFYSYRLAGN